MKKLLAFLCLVALLAVPVSAESWIVPTNIALTGTGCGGVSITSPLANAFDGDNSTRAKTNVKNTQCEMTYDFNDDAFIDHCNVYYWGSTSAFDIGGVAGYTGTNGTYYTIPCSDDGHYCTRNGTFSFYNWNYAIDVGEINCVGYPGTGEGYEIVDFTAVPTSALAPETINLYDNSTLGPGTVTYNWSGSGPGTMFWGDLTTQNTSVYLVTPGNYTINHGVSTPTYSGNMTKNDYIWIYNSTATVTTGFKAINMLTGYGVNNAQVDLQDIENTSWTNTTTDEGFAQITTLGGHTINAYATATGYDAADLLAQPAVNQKLYTILMKPTGIGNVSAGNVTLYVTVEDFDTLDVIQGAGVSAYKPTDGASFTLSTNAAGMATFIVRNNSNYIVSAEKTGYNGQSKTVATGTGSGGTASVSTQILLSKKTYTPTVTPVITTLPGGGTPVPTLTYIGRCTSDTDTSDACRADKNSNLMDQLRDAGPGLISLCILAIIMGLLKMMFG